MFIPPAGYTAISGTNLTPARYGNEASIHRTRFEDDLFHFTTFAISTAALCAACGCFQAVRYATRDWHTPWEKAYSKRLKDFHKTGDHGSEPSVSSRSGGRPISGSESGTRSGSGSKSGTDPDWAKALG